MRALQLIAVSMILGILLGGCGEAPGEDLSKKEAQPAADLQKGAQAKTIEEWSAANPNNGAPGHGDSGK